MRPVSAASVPSSRDHSVSGIRNQIVKHLRACACMDRLACATVLTIGAAASVDLSGRRYCVWDVDLLSQN